MGRHVVINRNMRERNKDYDGNRPCGVVFCFLSVGTVGVFAYRYAVPDDFRCKVTPEFTGFSSTVETLVLKSYFSFPLMSFWPSTFIGAENNYFYINVKYSLLSILPDMSCLALRCLVLSLKQSG